MREALALLAARGVGNGAKPGRVVEERFAWLHKMVEMPASGGASQLERVIEALEEAYSMLATQLLVGAPGEYGGLVFAHLSSLARTSHSPLDRWLAVASSFGGDATDHAAAADIQLLWEKKVLPVCNAIVTGRYPFDRASKVDVSLNDLQLLFGIGGELDIFHVDVLAPLNDTSISPWTNRADSPPVNRLSDEALAMLERSVRIREALFANGSPGASISITLQALDPEADSVKLSIGETELEFTVEDASKERTILWPDFKGVASVEFAPQGDSQVNRITDGSWAFLRPLDKAEVRKTNVTMRNRVIFNIGGRLADFEIASGEKADMFAPDLLTGFRCIETLR